ncbi:hypothetical protein B0T22DRAFT_479982 [Podospora appendiculata]|uniref:Uncharacterized protein n=1 Tax=Podospora appendiculata TaxID=314037 RepID=A0AAE0X9W2_9PEZI|nr:hypothetical protein B0T22DRAFT_479982 [Podospora appendiculata]
MSGGPNKPNCKAQATPLPEIPDYSLLLRGKKPWASPYKNVREAFKRNRGKIDDEDDEVKVKEEVPSDTPAPAKPLAQPTLRGMKAPKSSSIPKRRSSRLAASTNSTQATKEKKGDEDEEDVNIDDESKTVNKRKLRSAAKPPTKPSQPKDSEPKKDPEPRAPNFSSMLRGQKTRPSPYTNVREAFNKRRQAAENHEAKRDAE